MLKNIILISIIINLGLSADIGITKILKPAGIAIAGVCYPKAQLSNFDSEEQDFMVYFTITIWGEEIYTNSKAEHLFGYETKIVEFNQWYAYEEIFVSKCSLALAGDINPDNDVYTTTAKVKSLTPGEWIHYDTVPFGERRKRVKDGACMVDGSRMGEHYLYVLKGNKTDEFYLYDVISGIWESKSPVPCGTPEGGNKYPKKGACMIRFEDDIYLAKGNKTRQFWKYNIPTDSWTLMTEIPAGVSGKGLKGGSSLAKGKIGNDKYIFLIKGSSTREFYAYNPNLNTWVEKAQTPYLERESKGKIKKGSCLTSDGEDVYLLKDKMNELWRYDCDLDTWFPKKSIPYYGTAMRKAKVKDGAAIVYTKGNQDYIYALKGGGTEFWCYSVELDDWMELTGIPRPPSNKKAKKGTALVEMGDVIFGLKGSNTRELFVYTKYDTIFPVFGVTSNNQVNQQGNLVQLPFNEFPVTELENLTIYNAAGRKLRIAGTQKDVWQGLKSGIYFITYLKNKEYNCRKIVITR